LATRRDDRRDEGVVVVEGAPLIAEALAVGCEVLEEYIAPGAAPVGTSPPIVLSPAALARVATTETPRPNLAVVRRPNPGDLNSSSCILVLDRVADPGNVGTLIRSAEAAGVDAVVVTPGTSDPFAPKAVRASAGAVFHQPIHELGLDRVISAGFVTVGTSSHLGEDHRSADWSGSVALILGNEAHGLDVDPDRWVRIVHRGRAESLNVAMAGTLLTFAMVNARAVG
jgi:TrmH family RNA methyltransferase